MKEESLERMDARYRFEYIEHRLRSFSDHRRLASNFGSYCISEYDPKAAFQSLSKIGKELDGI